MHLKKLLSIEFEFESKFNRSTYAMIWSLPFPVFLAIGQSECDERLVEQANEFKSREGYTQVVGRHATCILPIEP